MKSNIVENNNSFTEFSQVWANYIFTDDVPANPPDLSEATSTVEKNNSDGTIYTIRSFEKTAHEKTYTYLLHVSNLKLSKEFRQEKLWKLEFGGEEESIRNVILPNTTATRKYEIKFSNGEYTIPFTSLDPQFDLSNCRLEINMELEKLYFSGWIYAGENLQVLLENNLPPFDDTIWLLKNKETGNRVSFHVNQETRYELPADNPENIEEKSHTILTTNVINQALNTFGLLDEGLYW